MKYKEVELAVQLLFQLQTALQWHMKTKHRSTYLAYKVIPVIIVALTVVGRIFAFYATQQAGARPSCTTHIAAPAFELKKIAADGLTDEEFRLSSIRRYGLCVFLMSRCNDIAHIIKRLHNEYAKKVVFFLPAR